MFSQWLTVILLTVCAAVQPIFIINKTNFTTKLVPKSKSVPKKYLTSKVDKYEPTWASLDSRPLPSWYDQSKIGIFIHWGVFSVPSFNSEWFWINWSNEAGNGSISDFMRKNYPPEFTYQDFAKDFTAEFFEPDQWADLFKDSGAKYIVLTSKHHEGYTLWPSKYSFSWNAVDVGPHRNLLGDLAASLRNRTDLHFGLYHSLYEWFHPLYLDDKANEFKTNTFVTTKTIPELYELVNDYRPDVIWSDGDWEANDTYWTSKEFLTWLYNDSPVKDTVVVNDRWGAGNGCNHGGFFNCADRYSPGVLQLHKWENALTIDRDSWGFRRNARLEQYLTIEELIREIVKTVSCGGNVLINVGPTKEGTINPVFEERLRQMGKWLSLNGDAIYGTEPWTFQNDTIVPDIWYTKKNGAVYAISLTWPEEGVLKVTDPQLSNGATLTLLGDVPTPLQYTRDSDGTTIIQLPDKALVDSEWAYTVQLIGVVN